MTTYSSYDIGEERGDIDVLAEQMLRNIAAITPRIEGARVDARLQLAQALADHQKELVLAMASRDRKRTTKAICKMAVELLEAGHAFGLPIDLVLQTLAAGGEADECFLT